MAAVPMPNVASVSVRGTLNDQLVENTLFYKSTIPITEDMLVTLLNAVLLVVRTDWLAILPSTYVLSEIFGYDMGLTSGIQAFVAASSEDHGAVSGNVLPNNVTLAVARKSGLRGRSFNGRVFWPGFTTSQQADENHVLDGTATLIIDALEATDAAAAALEWLPVIVSLITGGEKRSVGIATALAEWLVTDTVFDSRRRRLPKRGV